MALLSFLRLTQMSHNSANFCFRHVAITLQMDSLYLLFKNNQQRISNEEQLTLGVCQESM